MTEVDKMAEETLTQIYDIVEGVDEEYDKRELDIIRNAFHQVAERTREECVRAGFKHANGSKIANVNSVIDKIRTAKWEDKDAL